MPRRSRVRLSSIEDDIARLREECCDNLDRFQDYCVNGPPKGFDDWMLNSVIKDLDKEISRINTQIKTLEAVKGDIASSAGDL